MRKKMLVAMLIAVACVFFAGGIYAKVADVVKVENKACPNTKGEIQFSHKKHAEDYAKKFVEERISFGNCRNVYWNMFYSLYIWRL